MASDKGSFETATKFRFKAMMESATHRLEAQMLYGGIGLGVTDSAQSATDNDPDVVVPLTAAAWAAGIWAGQEGAQISLFTAAAGTPSAVDSNKFTLVGVDNANKAITLKTSGTAAAAALVVEVDAADYDVFFNKAKGNEMVGLRSIVSNTGDLYGISGASYGLWQGNTFAVGTKALTLKLILQGINLAVSKGLREDAVVLVSPATYALLVNDEAALRRYGAEKVGGRGASDGLMFIGPSGNIEVRVHPMVREAEAMAFPKGKAERIGATDLTFKTPGREEEMFQQSATLTGYEVRLYSEQSIFLPCPSHCVLFTGISNA
jgi:hypothetical protein